MKKGYRIIAVIVIFTLVLTLAPFAVQADEMEDACICEELCEPDLVNEACSACTNDAALCAGVDQFEVVEAEPPQASQEPEAQQPEAATHEAEAMELVDADIPYVKEQAADQTMAPMAPDVQVIPIGSQDDLKLYMGNDDMPYILNVVADFLVNQTIDVKGTKYLMCNDGDHTITRSGSEAMFQLGTNWATGELHLGGGTGTLTLDGGQGNLTLGVDTVPNGSPIIRQKEAQGTLHIKDGVVLQNSKHASSGGAVYISAGNAYMSGGLITGNYAGSGGGGIYNYNGTFSMTGGIIENNRAGGSGNAGGGGVNNRGTFIFTGGKIINNAAHSYSISGNGTGGGVTNTQLNAAGTATFEMYCANGNVPVIAGNTTGSGEATGVMNGTGATFVFSGGRIGEQGAGQSVENRKVSNEATARQPVFTMKKGSDGAIPEIAYGSGSGMTNNGVFNMMDGRIYGHTGEGVKSGGEFNFSGGKIDANGSYGVNLSASAATMNNEDGGSAPEIANNGNSGVYVQKTATFNMAAGSIYHNDAKEYGGGVRNAGIFTFTGGSISQNAAPANTGAGVFHTGNSSTTIGGTAQLGTSDTDNGLYIANKDYPVTIADDGLGLGARVNIEAVNGVAESTDLSQYPVLTKASSIEDSEFAVLRSNMAGYGLERGDGNKKVYLTRSGGGGDPTDVPTKNQFSYSLAAKAYNGKAQGVSVTPKTGVGTVTAIYYNGSATVPVNAGDYTITVDVAASTDYTAASGIELGTYTISKANTTTAQLTYDLADKTYNGVAQGVSVTPKSGVGKVTAIYYNGSETIPANAGSYAVTVDVAAGTNYLGVNKIALGTYKINKAKTTKAQLTSTLTAKTYNTKAQGVSIKPKSGVGRVTAVYYNGSTTVPKNAGSYAITVNVAAGTNYNAANKIAVGTYKINKANISAVKIADAVWTGLKLKPTKATFNGVSLKVSSISSKTTYGTNKNIGKGTVKLIGKGNFTGTKTIAFKINPKKNSVSKIAVGKKQMKVTWKKASSAQKITKYQVRYRVKGTSTWTTKTYAGNKSAATIKSLKKGKRYEVQVRSYKTVSNVKYYSAWSAVKQSVSIK